MKEITVAIIGLGVMGMLGFGFVNANGNGNNPFDLLWEAITGLQGQVDNIELIPGPPGPPGPPGEPSWDETRIADLEQRVDNLANLHCEIGPASGDIIVIDNFNCYENGSVVGQGDWVGFKNGDNFVVQGGTTYEGAKALYNTTQADSVVTKSGIALSDGRQAFYVRTEDRANWSEYEDGNAQFRVSKGGWGSDTMASATFKRDGNVAYYDGDSDTYVNFDVYNNNEWTLLEIEWRSSDAKARYRVNGGIWTDWKIFRGAASFTDFDNVGFDFVSFGGSGGVYFDTLH